MNHSDSPDASAPSLSCSVIIPTRLRANVLPRTLDSLAKQTRVGFEVIVVCDGEDPGTRALSNQYTAHFPLSWIFTTENHGQAFARNLGARHAKSEILIFLDDDMSVVAEWIQEHCDAHKEGAVKIVAVGRIIEARQPEPGPHTERLLRESWVKYLDLHQGVLARSDFNPDALTPYRHRCFGVNCSIAKHAFLERGGFDESLSFIQEDMEFGARLHDRGMRFVMLPRATIFHRDTKVLRDYLEKCWRSGGRIDAYRAITKNQRNPQTATLGTVRSNNPLRRLKLRLCWDHPGLVRQTARLFAALTDATGSRLSFKLWCRMTNSASYWESVKVEVATRESLRRSIGWPVPVLAFHSISDPPGRRHERFHTSPKRFRTLMSWLSDHGYRFCFPSGQPADEHSAWLTFDDGYEDFYFNVFPYLRELRLKPTVFLVTDCIGGTNAWDEAAGFPSRRLLNKQQILEMSRHGVRFGSHTLTHPWLPDVSDAELRREVVESKWRLEDLLGSEIDTFAYPGGCHDERVRAAVAEAGYKLAFSTRPALNFFSDPFSIERVEIDDNDTLLDLRLKMATGRPLKGNTITPLKAVAKRIAQAGMDRMPDSWADRARRHFPRLRRA